MAIVVGFIVLIRERRMVAREEAIEASEARAEALAQGEPLAPAAANMPPDAPTPTAEEPA